MRVLLVVFDVLSEVFPDALRTFEGGEVFSGKIRVGVFTSFSLEPDVKRVRGRIVSDVADLTGFDWVHFWHRFDLSLRVIRLSL